MKKNFFIEFSSPLSKDEKCILKKIILDFENEVPLTYPIASLKVPKLKNSKEKFVERLGKKGVFLGTSSLKSFCPFFSKIVFSNKFVSLELNPRFLFYLTDTREKSNYNLMEVIFFKHQFSIDFFYKILNENLLKNTIALSLDGFRELINLEGYERLYDLKRFVLQPLVEDISLNTGFEIEFLIKKESKSYIIHFKIQNKKMESVKSHTRYLLKLYKPYILDKKKTGLLIFNSINIYGYEPVKQKIYFCIKNQKKYTSNFDELLRVVLDTSEKEFILIKEVNLMITNIYNFRSYIHKELEKLKILELESLDYCTRLTRELFKIKDKKEIPISIISENLKVVLVYNPKEISNIKIFKRNINHPLELLKRR